MDEARKARSHLASRSQDQDRALQTSDGGYILGAGSSIDGKFYEYLDPEAPIAALPENILTQLRELLGKVRSLTSTTGAG
jgi:hypothetical protein